MSDPERWAPGRVVLDGLVVGLVLLAVGALGGRVDLALLGVAPVLVGERALRGRPKTRVPVSTGVVEPVPGEIRSQFRMRARDDVRAVRVRASLPGTAPLEAVVALAGTRELAVRTTSRRTGPQPAPSLEHAGIGVYAATRSETGTTHAPAQVVLPRALPLADAPLPVRLRGLAGTHEARRLGEGGSLHDVHPFAPGDRRARIDWRTTARRSPQLGEIYVRRTQVLAEATVTVVVDSRDDVGPDPATWRDGLVPPADRTSLDITREAAATLAQHYLAAGDRVALEDLGRRRRPVRPGAGRRHLDRVVHQLALMAPEGEPLERVRPPQITSGSLVYVLSTFLDPQAAVVALLWRQAGHRVVAVDVLPPLVVRRLDARQRLALRMVRLRRTDRLAELAASDIACLTWTGGTQAAALLTLARQTRAGRR